MVVDSPTGSGTESRFLQSVAHVLQHKPSGSVKPGGENMASHTLVLPPNFQGAEGSLPASEKGKETGIIVGN